MFPPHAAPPHGNHTAPMLPDIEIYRTANVLVSLYDDDAPAIAQERVEALAYGRDTEGVAVWLRIGQAVAELRQMRPVEWVQ